MLQFDPFRDFDRITRETRDRPPSVMAFDAIRDDDAVTLYFDVPGITAEDLDINVDRSELTITAQRVWDGDDKEILVNERPQGSFTRRLMLSDSLDTEQLEANLAEGVLTVTIPVAERSKPRKIEVTTESERDQIEVSGREASGDEN
ncbi:MAG TPA: Hsp20/alpha crystallin family protein [Acidimicrobiia bacterium]|nr:Hsp20/alpha crystallin family protein [Acidimicrobiia bacterium]